MHGVRLQLRRPRCDVGTSATVHSRRGEGPWLRSVRRAARDRNAHPIHPGSVYPPPLAYFRARQIGFARVRARKDFGGILTEFYAKICKIRRAKRAEQNLWDRH